MNYMIAWAVYVLAALGLLGIYWFFFEGYLARTPALLLRVLLAAILFTPWLVSGANGSQPAPACIAVLFALLSHSSYDACRALMPILGVSLLGIVALLLIERFSAQAEPATPADETSRPGH